MNIFLNLGIVLAIVLLALEHIYFKYVRKMLAKKDSGGCCALVSLVRLQRFINYDSTCLLYTSPSPRDKRQSRMPSSA